MGDAIKKHFFSFSGLTITLAVLGFLSGIVQLFIDVNTQVSVKWLLLALLVLLSVCFILLKVVFDVWQSRTLITSQECPIKFLVSEKILIIRKNESFLNNILVGCYMSEDDVERLILVGVVHLVQEKIIQIKIIKELIDKKTLSALSSQLSDMIIRPVIPFNIFSELGQKEENNV